MNCELDDKHEKLKYYYDEISKTYPNIKHIFSSHRDIESSSVNKLQCNYYTNGILSVSYTHLLSKKVIAENGRILAERRAK